MRPMLRVGARQRHFTWLLASLLLLLIAESFAATLPLGSVLTNILLGLTLIASIYPFSERRLMLWGAGSLAVVMFAALWVAMLTGLRVAELTALAAGAVFYTYTAVTLIGSILVRVRISADDLAGAIGAYLLLGISGAFVFAFLNVAAPGSLVATTGAIAAPVGKLLGQSFGEYLYFSFTCLTTLGFGDLVPASAQTRVFAYLEAVIGQVYLTVLVARLVGLHLSRARVAGD